MAQVSPLFLLPNTSTVLAHTAINLLKSADQAVLDEAIQTLLNKNLAAPAVMPVLEQSVNFSEVLEKLSRYWTDETVRAFATAFSMDPAKRDVMDAIVAIAILNEADLESELRSENMAEATPNDLLENRRITWQYPPPGTVLNPPYVVLVAVETVDRKQADSEIQAILGELVDYKGYKIPRRDGGGPLKLSPELIDLLRPRIFKQPPVTEAVSPATTQPALTSPNIGRSVADVVSTIAGAASQPAATPAETLSMGAAAGAASDTVRKALLGGVLGSSGGAGALSRVIGGL